MSSLGLTVYILGFAFGPLVWGNSPFSLSFSMKIQHFVAHRTVERNVWPKTTLYDFVAASRGGHCTFRMGEQLGDHPRL